MQMLLGKKVLFHGQHALNVHLLQYSLKKKKRQKWCPILVLLLLQRISPSRESWKAAFAIRSCYWAARWQKPTQSINGGLIVCAAKRQ